MTTPPTTAVADLADLPPGTLRQVEHAGRLLLLANVDGEIFATDALCSHDAAPLAEGELEDATVVCPWHFSRFCLRTGDVLDSPASTALGTVPVRVADGRIYLG